MPYYADLHCHSTASDGSDAPARVVERAKAAGLKVLALTDHDTTAGVPEAIAAGNNLGVKVLPGTELTCYVEGKEVHVLGYGLDYDNDQLKEHCARFQEARLRRAREIGERLAAHGVPVDMDKVMAEADGGVVGRPHVARALVEAGHVKDFQEAFDLYLAEGKPCAVGKMPVTAQECVKVIKEAGGIAVMAHPYLGPRVKMIPALLQAGAVGIEVWHSAQDEAQSAELQVLAEERGLLKTAGSDCHGTIKGCEPILGKWGLQEQQWRKVEKALEKTWWGASTTDG